MSWTKKIPERDGYYWCKIKGDPDPKVGFVYGDYEVGTVVRIAWITSEVIPAEDVIEWSKISLPAG